jgi:tight adherence protein B
MDSLLLVFAIAGFLAVGLLVEGGYLLWSAHRSADARRLQARLLAIKATERGAGDGGLVKRRRLSESAALARALARIPRIEVFDRLLLQSGLQRTVAGWLGQCLGGALAGLLLWMIAGAPAWTVAVCIGAGAAIPTVLVLRARRKRLRTIEQQLPDALDLMSRALRAGHAFAGALQMVGDEGPEPICAEFRATFDEVNYGVQMQEALRNLAARVPVADLRFFVIAVAIQRETGGNLTELLDKLSSLVRARFKLLATIRVLATEGRLSAWILSALPFVLLGLINLINPRFMSILWTDSAGIMAIWAGGGFLLVGLGWMWRVTRIRI